MEFTAVMLRPFLVQNFRQIVWQQFPPLKCPYPNLGLFYAYFKICLKIELGICLQVSALKFQYNGYPQKKLNTNIRYFVLLSRENMSSISYLDNMKIH